MRGVLLTLCAAVGLCGTPAAADNGQVFDAAAQLRAYPSPGAAATKQCFNGKVLSGVSRSGLETLYVQPRSGQVYRLRLAGNCSALDVAEKLAVRADGSDVVCAGDGAQLVVKTAGGAAHCRISDVRALTSREVASLAAASPR